MFNTCMFILLSAGMFLSNFLGTRCLFHLKIFLCDLLIAMYSIDASSNTKQFPLVLSLYEHS